MTALWRSCGRPQCRRRSAPSLLLLSSRNFAEDCAASGVAWESRPDKMGGLPMRTAMILSATLVSCGFGLNASAQQADMSYFITSAGSGKGGDLGGLAGADAH